MSSKPVEFICSCCDQKKTEINPENDCGDYYCEDCIDHYYDNKTGHCSFYCCMGGGCDGSC